MRVDTGRKLSAVYSNSSCSIQAFPSPPDTPTWTKQLLHFFLAKRKRDNYLSEDSLTLPFYLKKTAFSFNNDEIKVDEKVSGIPPPYR